MKTGIHPPYHSKASISCACGAKFEVGSTKEKLQTEYCSQCHPFYTGKQKLVDAAGRVDRFEARRKATVAMSKAKTEAKTKRKEEKVEAAMKGEARPAKAPKKAVKAKKK